MIHALLVVLLSHAADFWTTQLKFARVRQAKTAKDAALKEAFAAEQLSYPPKAIFIRVFKQQKRFEVWVSEGEQYKLFRAYPICASSGSIGPKQQEGDGQVPEGFYELADFNPTSNYHLALKVGYPNASDRALSKARSLGGDIYIHGNCVTIGCIPLTDPLIEEVYLLAVSARAAGQAHIPIHIFPTTLDDDGQKRLEGMTNDESLRAFWRNLQPGYVMFEKTHTVPKVRVGPDGRYVY